MKRLILVLLLSPVLAFANDNDHEFVSNTLKSIRDMIVGQGTQVGKSEHELYLPGTTIGDETCSVRFGAWQSGNEGSLTVTVKSAVLPSQAVRNGEIQAIYSYEIDGASGVFYQKEENWCVQTAPNKCTYVGSKIGLNLTGGPTYGFSWEIKDKVQDFNDINNPDALTPWISGVGTRVEWELRDPSQRLSKANILKVRASENIVAHTTERPKASVECTINLTAEMKQENLGPIGPFRNLIKKFW